MVHGGRLDAAARAYGGAPDQWLDLSTGINPNPWLGAASIAVDWRALPSEAALAGLEHAAADHFGVAPGHVCALPGSEIGIRMLGRLGLGAEGAHVAPAYRTHEVALDGAMPIATDAVAAARADGRTVLLANPNNPDGRLLPRAMLRDAADAGAGWLIVDEAFADLHPDASVAADVADHRRLLVLRSFGKFFGLAGLRLGFAVAPRPIIAALRGLLGAWPVSSAAIAIGTAAYRDHEWIASTRARLVADAAAFDALLARHGLAATGDCPLFRLVAHDDAAALFDRLARHHILCRPFDYAPRWLRFGLPGDAAAQDRLDWALAHG
ncbi:threonine-phosphate decarboxylase CobD [Sphingomonas zeicaulis]|uniref:threonine-phosphate decarboxylase CobD n=1 Tax=Sphingomonas zeicaulis TaxID=1632740 RepID=UPI003D1EFA0A